MGPQALREIRRRDEADAQKISGNADWHGTVTITDAYARLVLPVPFTQNFAVIQPGIRMSLVVVGINHRTAPVEVRERVVFEPARIPDALHELRTLPDVRESVIVSTCNRTELYCVTDTPQPAELGTWLQRYHDLGASIHHCLYHHVDGQGRRARVLGRVGPRFDGASASRRFSAS